MNFDYFMNVSSVNYYCNISLYVAMSSPFSYYAALIGSSDI